jgi:hypothetical protein
MSGCYLFFLAAFFFAGMFFPSCFGVSWICRGWPDSAVIRADTPISSRIRRDCQVLFAVS